MAAAEAVEHHDRRASRPPAACRRQEQRRRRCARRRPSASETSLAWASAGAARRRATARHASNTGGVARARKGSPAIRSPGMDPRPVGVFDSGMGGLTVLHECLVTMPHEDFVYLGDDARLPVRAAAAAGDPALRARDRRATSRRRA